MKSKYMQIIVAVGAVIAGVWAVLYLNYEPAYTHDDSRETTCAENIACATPRGYAHAGAIYLDYDLEGSASVSVLKIVANDRDLANCTFHDAVHAPRAGMIPCRLDRDSMVAAYVQTRSSGLIRIGWHQ